MKHVPVMTGGADQVDRADHEDEEGAATVEGVVETATKSSLSFGG